MSLSCDVCTRPRFYDGLCEECYISASFPNDTCVVCDVVTDGPVLCEVCEQDVQRQMDKL